MPRSEKEKKVTMKCTLSTPSRLLKKFNLEGDLNVKKIGEFSLQSVIRFEHNMLGTYMLLGTMKNNIARFSFTTPFAAEPIVLKIELKTQFFEEERTTESNLVNIVSKAELVIKLAFDEDEKRAFVMRYLWVREESANKRSCIVWLSHYSHIETFSRNELLLLQNLKLNKVFKWLERLNFWKTHILLNSTYAYNLKHMFEMLLSLPGNKMRL